jgi:predicted nucleic acid-binding protein
MKKAGVKTKKDAIVTALKDYMRRKGITVPTVDIIIAAAAKIYNCSLLHHDKYFRALAKHLHISAVDYIDN